MDDITSIYKPHGGHNCGHDHGAGGHHHEHHDHGSHGKAGHCDHDHSHAEHNGSHHEHSHTDHEKLSSPIPPKNLMMQTIASSSRNGIIQGHVTGGGEHNHDHHDHGNKSKKSGHNEENINVRAAIVHVIGDILQSIGVIIASVLIYFWPQAKIADPICTYVFSVLVLFTTIPVFTDCLKVLME